MTNLLRVEGLAFSYRKRHVLSDVTFEARDGVTALLGPNGAGKSTLFGCIAGIRKPSAGTISIPDGLRVGYVPQVSQMPRGATVDHVLHYAGWLCGYNGAALTDSVDQAVSTLNLASLVKRRVVTLSGGERQKVALAVGIIDNPQILLLDEPTVGLDPAYRFHLRETIAQLGENRCVLLSTHLIEDVAQIANNIILLSGGTSIFSGSITEFVTKFTAEENVTTSTIERAYEVAVTASLKEQYA